MLRRSTFASGFAALGVAAAVVAAAAVHAQTPAVPAPVEGTAAPAGTEQKIERIRVEDSGARIDELRVGGETRNITVSPKGGAPAYEVLPAGSRTPATGNREGNASSGGARVWNVLNF